MYHFPQWDAAHKTLSFDHISRRESRWIFNPLIIVLINFFITYHLWRSSLDVLVVDLSAALFFNRKESLCMFCVFLYAWWNLLKQIRKSWKNKRDKRWWYFKFSTGQPVYQGIQFGKNMARQYFIFKLMLIIGCYNQFTVVWRQIVCKLFVRDN